MKHFLFKTLRRNLSVSPSIPTSHGTLYPNTALQLLSGETLPASAMKIHYATYGHQSNPAILVAPSMSNSCFVTDHPDIPTDKPHGGMWWNTIIGNGNEYGIDLNKYYVVSFTPLGSPFGSTSPLTNNPDNNNKPYGNMFPIITPKDQAAFIKLGLDTLGIDTNTNPLHCIIGGSMGGMQILEYAAQFPNTYHKMCTIATTGWTSPSTVALRSIQRKIVKLDPKYTARSIADSDNNHNIENDEETVHILEGLLITRMMGTICYRSRDEFDDRFNWNVDNFEDKFEVENYLEYQGNKFATYYDANCYLVLSYCMDRMNLGYGYDSYKDGVLRIPNDKNIMLISYDTDYLIPAMEMQNLSAILGSRKDSKVYYECLHSKYGHDTFLIDKEMNQLIYRLKPFLEGDINDVYRVVTQELH